MGLLLTVCADCLPKTVMHFACDIILYYLYYCSIRNKMEYIGKVSIIFKSCVNGLWLAHIFFTYMYFEMPNRIQAGFNI